MKALSLLQPWASLVVTTKPNCSYGGKHIGIKQWETRSWRPQKKEILDDLVNNGFLIHASLGWKQAQSEFCDSWPYSEYEHLLPTELPLGKIIGHVFLDRIWTTGEWKRNVSGETESNQEEYRFGDYSDGRFAWSLHSPTLFEEPIIVKGSLNLWDYNGPLPEFLNK
jgi:hypothetical protein